MSVLTRNNFIEGADGSILLSIEQDQTDIAQAVQGARDSSKGWTADRTMKMSYSIPAHEYHEWGRKLGYECWQDDDFLKFFSKHAPQFAL